MLTTKQEVQRLRDRWRTIGLLVGGLALVVTLGAQLILLVPTTYTATSAVALRPLTAEQSADSIEMQAHEFGVTLGAKESAAEVLAEVAPDRPPQVAVTATRDPGTATIRIAVSSTNRDVAVDVANGLAERAEELGGTDQMAQVVVAVRAGAAGVTSGPPRRLYFAALVALAALLLAGGLYRIRERTP